MGLLLALSFLPGATGVPLALAGWQRRLLGAAAPALPAYVFLAGLVLVAAGERARFTRRIGGILLASLTALAIAHAQVVTADPLDAGLEGRGGGLVGGIVVAGTLRVLGTTGLWVALGVLGAVSIGLIGGLTTASLGSALRAGSRALGSVLALAARLARRFIRAAAGTLRDLSHTAIPMLARAARAAIRRMGDAAAAAGAALRRRAVRARTAESWNGPADAIPAAVGPPQAEAPENRSGIQADAYRGEPETPEAMPGTPAAAGVPQLADLRDRRRRPRAAHDTADEAQERLRFSAVDYRLPPQSMLGDNGGARTRTRVDPADTARALEQTLESFGVKVRVVNWEVGPVVTRFEVHPEPGVKVQKITSLTNDIALNLAAQSVRIEAPIPGKSAVGIELPNQKASLVHLREILSSDAFQKAASPLVVAVGKDIAGHPVVAELTEMPHLLIAGATGSGKSVALNAMIASLLFRCTPRLVRFVMIDPKRVELTDYNEIPHLLTPVVTNPRQAASVLKDMLRVMEQRFELFAQAGARNIQSYNQLTDVEPLYYIVIIIDELADLMMVAPADFEDIICRLAQMTRATGIHLVVATQRPSVDVITGLIKANIPSRLAFAVSSQVDSRTILDTTGAEKLLGRGDMLFLPLGASRAIRAQGAYVADDEIRAVVEWWRSQGRPAYDQQLVEAQHAAPAGEHTDGERLIEAARLVVRSGYGSVSLLQRKMRIGYVTAARLIDELEARGIVGPVQGSNPREVLVGLDELERSLRARPSSRKE
jgi:S-DNA-T family DNA segregation ATPase FtsK/SpoIIIE